MTTPKTSGPSLKARVTSPMADNELHTVLEKFQNSPFNQQASTLIPKLPPVAREFPAT